MHHLILLLLLTLCCVTVTAADPSENLYQKFVDTPKWLDPDNPGKVSDALELACNSSPVPECVAYIRGNEVAVRAQLPDNPQFWQNFYALVDSGSIPLGEVDPGTWQALPHEYMLLLETYVSWAQYELAFHGVVPLERAARVYSGLRRLSREPNHMITIQTVGAGQIVAVQWLNVAIAMHAESPNRIQKIGSVLEPLNHEERSFRNILDAELMTTNEALAAMPKNVHEFNQARERLWRNLSKDPLVDFSPSTQAELDNDILEAHQYVKDMVERREQIIAYSELPANEYWSRPKLSPAQGQLGWQYAVGNFNRNNAVLDIYNRILRALSPMYTGELQPSTPTIASTPHWSWDWRRATNTLCMVPTTVHSDHLSSGLLEICLPYFGKLSRRITLSHLQE